MALDDYVEAEVGVAVAVTAAVTAAVASPPVRKVLRQGAVYGLAGLLMAGDKLSALARGVKEGAQKATASAVRTASDAASSGAQPAPEGATR